MPQTTLISTLDPKVRTCTDDCTACGNSCLNTMSYCLHMGGRHADPSHLTLLANCAEICRTSAAFMLTCSEFSNETCDVCASVCEACAVSCEAFRDEQMASCAELCRTCAESCTEMASM